jgi:hypothetical protein
MKNITLPAIALFLILCGGCVYPYHYTQMTGYVSFPAKDHVLCLSAVSFQRNAKRMAASEWPAH